MSDLIELNELRIRNVLWYKGELYYVSMLSMDIDDEYQEIIGVTPLAKTTGEKSDWNRAMIGDLLRVPLTEEWLFKFGFENGRKGLLMSVCPMYTAIQGYIPDKWRVDLLGPVPHMLKTDLQYVHQLQNLYFALTGTDLI